MESERDNPLVQSVRKRIAGKRVLILGFGREGKSSLNIITRAGGYAFLAVSDRREIREDERTELLEEFSGLPTFITGEDYLTRIDDYDIVFKSPGIVLDKPLENYKAMITSQAECFLHVYGAQTIGITGTKGKSTTSSLLYHVLKESGIPSVLLGNIGIPAFDMCDDITKETKIVFELSSHQLENCVFSPSAAIYLNLFPEHLDHYKGFDEYRLAKENIYKHQSEGDRLYCGSTVIPKAGECRSEIIAVYDMNRESCRPECDKSVKIAFVNENVMTYNGNSLSVDMEKLPFMGFHNLFNAAAVYAVCKDLGISNENFERALYTYKPLSHRLELIGVYDGVKYYDDSISTIPAAAIEAMNSIKDADTVIIGGMDRGIDYSPLIEYLEQSSVPNIILMESTGFRIYEEIKTGYMKLYNSERLILVNNLSEAVEAAKRVTRRGKACVMSPAAASYGIFKNFEERGDVFKELVRGGEG